MREKEFNALYNEGEEGYNPFACPSAAPEMTREERMDQILHILEGISSQDPRYRELRAEWSALYEQEWSLEVTKARRAAWNPEMAAAKKAGRKVNLLAAEKKMGFTFAALKAAIVHHKL